MLGLVGESGEVAEKVKKIIRDADGKITDDVKLLLLKELGDVLWYLAAVSYELDMDLSLVADINLNKLYERKANNTLHGSGDNR